MPRLVREIERVISARLNLWNIAKASLSMDVPVVLDDGFFLRQTRNRYRSLCALVRAEPVLHYLNTSIAEIQARLVQRNAQLPKENFFITFEMLERMFELFEIPGEDETPIIVNDSGVEQQLPSQLLP